MTLITDTVSRGGGRGWGVVEPVSTKNAISFRKSTTITGFCVNIRLSLTWISSLFPQNFLCSGNPEDMTSQNYLPMTSAGSDLSPSGCCPCSMSRRACRARAQSTGWDARVSLINSNTPHSPIPTICKERICVLDKEIFLICISRE